jgi:hypothetical protein
MFDLTTVDMKHFLHEAFSATMGTSEVKVTH